MKTPCLLVLATVLVAGWADCQASDMRQEGGRVT